MIFNIKQAQITIIIRKYNKLKIGYSWLFLRKDKVPYALIIWFVGLSISILDRRIVCK